MKNQHHKFLMAAMAEQSGVIRSCIEHGDTLERSYYDFLIRKYRTEIRGNFSGNESLKAISEHSCYWHAVHDGRVTKRGHRITCYTPTESRYMARFDWDEWD